MSILEKEVYVSVNATTYEYFEKLGYNIPRYINKQGRVVLAIGEKILVKTSDLQEKSNALVTKICDKCGKVVEKQKYQIVMRSRNDGEDFCRQCTKLVRKIIYERSLEYYAINNNKDHILKEFSRKNKVKPSEIFASTRQEVLWNCPDCNSEYAMSVKLRRLGSNCPYCAGQRVNETNSFYSTRSKLIFEWHPIKNGDLTPHDVLPNSHKKVWWKCQECSHEWEAVLKNRYLNNSSCPQCKESKGELRLREMLTKYAVLFEPQFKLDALKGRNGGKLKFDFAIFDKQNNLLLLIEYDGEFHFKEYYEGQNFKTLQIHDQLKNSYCVKNNISLIRIPYWDYESIDLIIKNVLAYLNIIKREKINLNLVYKHLVNHSSWSYDEYIAESLLGN